MLTSRSNGASRVTSRPPRCTAPAVGASKPAIIRSTVVLPEPDGPSIAKNSPSRDLEVDRVDGHDVVVGAAAAAEHLAQPDEAHRSLAHRHLRLGVPPTRATLALPGRQGNGFRRFHPV